MSEAETRLDLAYAYAEMGQVPDAIAELEAVLGLGNPEQRLSASLALGGLRDRLAGRRTVTMRRLLHRTGFVQAIEQLFAQTTDRLRHPADRPDIAAESLFSALPPGHEPADKLVLGLYDDDALVGCVDLVRRWPEPQVATLNLLLVTSGRQRRGLGRAAYRQLEVVARGWGRASLVRTGVAEDDAVARGFLARLGFVETGERQRAQTSAGAVSVRVLEKPIGE